PNLSCPNNASWMSCIRSVAITCMKSSGNLMTNTLVKPAPNTSPRTPTQSVQVFIRDPESVETVRQSLGTLGLRDAEFINGSIENAITLLAQQGSPQLLIVDVSGIDDPISRVNELANVCAPNTGVIV